MEHLERRIKKERCNNESKIFSDCNKEILTNIVNEFLDYCVADVKHVLQSETLLNNSETKITISIWYEYEEDC